MRASLPSYRRLHVVDPFGNQIELLEKAQTWRKLSG
jgi:hypothetical protein